ncbi:hypothetical protein K9N68_32635 [Kovacikia minuta CCNUW1]|uniref:hypothetical protein n=1 Tax=Kovacikia minuta TaxID=2931930 RepID=UPI001CCD3FBE|nr:hypothetical protein [Kovacikia minuta]UBF26206.1 hypothetical protein K9N68_32635 [Kovacikia minuta CCNUW1]
MMQVCCSEPIELHGSMITTAYFLWHLHKGTTTDLFQDRCHHSIVFDETAKPGEIDLSLDWQRTFVEEEKITKEFIEKQIDACCEAALKYFEVVAEGDLNYD